MGMFLFLIAVAGALLLIVFVDLQRRRRHRAHVARRAWEQWHTLSILNDPSRRILEAESILDRALRDLGYQGTFGEKLKKLQKSLSNIDAVWLAHKLRNRIAHEPGTVVRPNDAATAIRAFEQTLETIIAHSLSYNSKKLRS